jgi:hypothetical protein
MVRKKDAVSTVAPPQRPVLSRIEALALIVLFVLGVLFAVPAMKDTHMGAVLAGKCEHDPKPALCTPLPDQMSAVRLRLPL